MFHDVGRPFPIGRGGRKDRYRNQTEVRAPLAPLGDGRSPLNIPFAGADAEAEIPGPSRNPAVAPPRRAPAQLPGDVVTNAIRRHMQQGNHEGPSKAGLMATSMSLKSGSNTPTIDMRPSTAATSSAQACASPSPNNTPRQEMPLALRTSGAIVLARTVSVRHLRPFRDVSPATAPAHN